MLKKELIDYKCLTITVKQLKEGQRWSWNAGSSRVEVEDSESACPHTELKALPYPHHSCPNTKNCSAYCLVVK